MTDDLEIKQASCDGKTPFSSRDDAMKAIRNAQSRSSGKGALNAYRCPCCDGWHVGMKFKRKSSSRYFNNR